MMKSDQTDLTADLDYQHESLQLVSRTFALTVPQLPPGMRTVVGNAYLLCRIVDTIEDSEVLSMDDKGRFYDQFILLVGDASIDPEPFGQELAPLLTGSTLEAERDLIRNTARVLRITHSFSKEDQAALHRCVRIMSEGMESFQQGQFVNGLRDLAHLDSYCYHVAGVVGEMLTQLFCAHSPAIARHRDELEARAVSFGQGLQMTNILKDIWDDRERRMCWLPQAVFDKHGFDLSDLADGPNCEAFQEGLAELLGVARAHLENALDYTLLIPKSEPGVRRFCLWAVGMAVLTIRKLNANRCFTAGNQVKISRRSVKATILFTTLFGRCNWLLKAAFRVLARPLPPSPMLPKSGETAAGRPPH